MIIFHIKGTYQIRIKECSNDDATALLYIMQVTSVIESMLQSYYTVSKRRV